MSPVSLLRHVPAHSMWAKPTNSLISCCMLSVKDRMHMGLPLWTRRSGVQTRNVHHLPPMGPHINENRTCIPGKTTEKVTAGKDIE
jgi:hypothetical protein